MFICSKNSVNWDAFHCKKKSTLLLVFLLIFIKQKNIVLIHQSNFDLAKKKLKIRSLVKINSVIFQNISFTHNKYYRRNSKWEWFSKLSNFQNAHCWAAKPLIKKNSHSMTLLVNFAKINCCIKLVLNTLPDAGTLGEVVLVLFRPERYQVRIIHQLR